MDETKSRIKTTRDQSQSAFALAEGCQVIEQGVRGIDRKSGSLRSTENVCCQIAASGLVRASHRYERRGHDVKEDDGIHASILRRRFYVWKKRHSQSKKITGKS